MKPVGQRYREAPTVLVVEDEWLMRDVLARELEDEGFTVLEAENGEEALAILRETARCIDLLLTDIRMPGSVDGWRLAEEARSLRPELPVIYATGYSHVQPRQVPKSVYLHKPFHLSHVIDAARPLGIAPPS